MGSVPASAVADERVWCRARGLLLALLIAPPAPGFAQQTGESPAADLARYEAACRDGLAAGCYLAGLAYERGDGVVPDFSRAAELYSRGCDSLAFDACTLLGRLHQRGAGVDRDLPRAAELYAKSCQGGHLYACTLQGRLYEEGAGVEPDLSRAAELFERGCDGGESSACRDLARVLLNGAGVPPDPSRAAVLLERSCGASDGYACELLAELYRDGRGVQRDGDRARALFEAACDAGTSHACDQLARGYASGTFVDQDLARTAIYLARACDLDNPFSCERLASAYENGRGVTRDASRAAELLRRACDGGNPGACRRLAGAHLEGRGVPADADRAVELLDRACREAADEFSCAELAEAFWTGSFTPRDEARAAALWKRACDAGLAAACRRIQPFEELRLVAIGTPEGESARVAYLLGYGEDLITVRAGQRLVTGTVLEVRDHTVLYRPVGDEAEARAKPLFETPAPGIAPASREWTGAPISVHFEGDLQILVEVLAEISGLNVIFEPGAGGRVRVSAREAPWDGVLARAVRDAGLDYQIDELPGLRIGPIGQREDISLPGPDQARGQPVSLRFRQGNMVDIASLFEEIAGRPVLIPEGPHEPLTIAVQEMPWERVLAWIAASRGWELQIDESRVIAEATPPPP